MWFSQNVLRMSWKKLFVQFSWKAHCFSVLKRIWGQCDDFENFDSEKHDLAKTCCVCPEKRVLYNFDGKRKTCCAWPKKSVLHNFYGKRTVFLFWREYDANVRILRTLTVKTAIWPKRAAHVLKRAFCTIFMESALFSRFGENFRPVWRFWELWRSKLRFAKTCCAWAEKSVLYNFHGKRTVFPFWREFEASFTILKTLTVKSALWPKRAAHDLKRAFCTIFMESALFSCFEENMMPMWGFWELWRSKLRFAQTCCACPENSV